MGLNAKYVPRCFETVQRGAEQVMMWATGGILPSLIVDFAIACVQNDGCRGTPVGAVVCAYVLWSCRVEIFRRGGQTRHHSDLSLDGP